jgi:hypothetical protein
VSRRLAPYVPPAMRSELYLVIGELHHPKRPQSAATPQWLIVSERGLFTGVAIFGAVGSGKTSGYICRKVRGILKRQDRSEDYVEISLGSPYRYNPLHSDLEVLRARIRDRFIAG